MKSKRGRPRGQGERYPSGDLRPDQGAATAETLRRRAELTGVPMDQIQNCSEAGYALGALLLRGVIDARQHDGGRAFAQDWNHWSLLAGLPAHQLRVTVGGCGRPDAEAEQWQKIRNRYLGACRQVKFVWAVVEQVVMDDWPSSAEQMAMFLSRPQAVLALRQGLDALADYYRIGLKKVFDNP